MEDTGSLEEEIVRMRREGRTYREIAEILSIDAENIKNIIAALYRKITDEVDRAYDDNNL